MDAAANATVQQVSMLQLIGAALFGAFIGWYSYYVNRYRTGEVQIGDIVTVLGAVGGGAVLTLFPAKSELFGAYGVGLFAGFFMYFITLLILVGTSKSFTVEFFLDGRRPKGGDGMLVPDNVVQRPMGAGGGGGIN